MDDRENSVWQCPAIAEEVALALLRGDNVLVHCMAGVHRAATVAAAIRAIVHEETWECAVREVSAVRNVEIPQAVK